MFRELVYPLSPLTAWVFFGVCLLAILFTGARLSRYGDVISIRTGLGGVWVGLILLAGVSSAPELVTGLSAILVVGEPDLAVGAALGSCVYNLVIIAVLDFIYKPGTIYSGIRHGHSLSAGFGVILLGTAASAIFLHGRFALAIGPIGPYTIAAPVIYLIAMRSVFFFERDENRVAMAAELAEAGGPQCPRAGRGGDRVACDRRGACRDDGVGGDVCRHDLPGGRHFRARARDLDRGRSDRRAGPRHRWHPRQQSV
jgi:Ca2+/Na+ antiporter